MLMCSISRKRKCSAGLGVKNDYRLVNGQRAVDIIDGVVVQTIPGRGAGHDRIGAHRRDAGAPVLVSVTPVMVSPFQGIRPNSVNAVGLKVSVVPNGLLSLLATMIKGAGLTVSVPLS